MLKDIITAAENFCIHQIREGYSLCDENNKKRTLIAYIDIQRDDSKKFRVYIAPDEGFAQRVSKLYLEEDESDEETLKDMTLELANLIVGSAKVIAEEANINPFTISTPNFEKIGDFDFEYDQMKIISVENDKLIVAIKEIE